MNEELSQSVIAQPTSSTPAAHTNPVPTSSASSAVEQPIAEQPIVTPPAHVPVDRAQSASVNGPERTTADTIRIIAHGSLDVMGGIAEYCGGLTLSTPALDRVVVDVLHRQDQKISIAYQDQGVSSGNTQPGHAADKQAADARFESPLSVFYAANGSFVSAEQIYKLGYGEGGTAVGLALASLRAILETKAVPHLAGGLTFSINSCLAGDAMRRKSALVTAILRGALAAMKIECSLSDRTAIGQRVLEDVAAYPCGLASVAAPMLDRPGFISPVSARPLGVCEALPMPEGVTLLGVESGVLHPKATEKYQQARTTAHMGGEIIARLADVQMGAGEKWHGHLARVTIGEYVDCYRDRLPTKLKGAQFLDRFGPLSQRSAVIDPQETYKIRSRTEHHIYEDERVRQFVERIARANRTGDQQAVIEAGELMYASHWSYGQRCGLGSCETDLLVKLLRNIGAKAGVYGARISGAGAGGTVVVLMQDSEPTRLSIARALNKYESERGIKASLQPAAEFRS